MKKSGCLGFVAAALLVGCSTPPPPAPRDVVVQMGVQNGDPASERICAAVAGTLAKEGDVAVVRDGKAPLVSARVTFGFTAEEKAQLDDWHLYTGALSMKATVRKPVVGEVIFAEKTVTVDGERRLGKDAARETLVGPLQRAAESWCRANITRQKIENASK